VHFRGTGELKRETAGENSVLKDTEKAAEGLERETGLRRRVQKNQIGYTTNLDS